jgi:uncharacterized protein (DUF1501 family)
MKRRDFLISGIASIGAIVSPSSYSAGLGIASNMMNMSKSVGDYKTLVCVFLDGGADSISLFVPTDDSEYSKYKKIRQNLSFSQSSINPLNSRYQDLDGVGLPDFISSFSSLFSDEKLSVVSNVGPLREPTSLAMIKQNDAILPPFMNSHNDHIGHWQTGFVAVNVRSGWGGRIVEAFSDSGAIVPSNISLKNTRKFVRGEKYNPFVVGSTQIKNLTRFIDEEKNSDLPLRDMFNKLTNKSSSILDKGFTSIVNSTLNNNKNLQSILETAADTAIVYPTSAGTVSAGMVSDFTLQLKRAAELIEIAPALGHHRQVIYVHLGGFDTHDNQATDFPGIMRLLADGMNAFQSDLEARGVDDRVVTFTQSEFGRTITINSNGTDHGWGGHQFVMGTPVKGGQVIGSLPEYAIGSSDIYQSSFIPQYSVEQYAGNLAKWYGIDDSEMLDIFPTYNRFDNVDFGLFG